MNSKTIFSVLLYIILINMLINVIGISVVNGSYDDVDLVGTIANGNVQIVPNKDEFEVYDHVNYDNPPIDDYGDAMHMIGEKVEEGTGYPFWYVVKNMGTFNYLVGMAFSYIFDQSNPIDGEETWIGYFEEFIGSVFTVFTFTTGLMSFRIIEVLESGGLYSVPDYAMTILFFAYYIPILIVMFWLAPFVVKILQMIAHWIDSVLPFT